MTKNRLFGIVVILTWVAALAMWANNFASNYGEASVWISSQRWLFVAFLMFALGDDISTAICLRQTGGQGEMNPFMNSLFQKKNGRLIATIIKWTFVAIVVFAIASDQATQTLLLCTTFFGLVVLNNIRAMAEYWLCPEATRKLRAIVTGTRFYFIRIVSMVAIAAFITYGMDILPKG